MIIHSTILDVMLIIIITVYLGIWAMERKEIQQLVTERRGDVSFSITYFSMRLSADIQADATYNSTQHNATDFSFLL